MLLDDIAKLAKLIEETKDDSVKPILRKLLGTWVEKEGLLQIVNSDEEYNEEYSKGFKAGLEAAKQSVVKVIEEENNK